MCLLAGSAYAGDETKSESAAGDKSVGGQQTKPLDLAYLLYRSDEIRSQPCALPAVESTKLVAARKVAFGLWLNDGINVSSRNQSSTTTATAVSTAPLSAGEKFGLFLSKSFKPPGPYAFSAFSSVLNELLDKNDGRVDDTGDFFADAGTRMARSMAFRTTANFFNKFAYPVIFKQDPRYHRSAKTSVGGKIGYAVSRVFITQGDRSGDQFNVSFIGGGLTAAAISNVWEREERRDVKHTLRRFGMHVGLTAMTNIIREFLGGQ